MAVLEAGGNAFDAAVAAGLVLQVVEPHLNGPGGEVPVVAWAAAEQRPFVVCGQGSAPAAATIGAFGDLGLDLVPGTGLLPACVPGAFGAWMLLLERWGTLPLRDVMGYAIGYAEAGHPVLPRVAATVELLADHFRAHWPTSAAQWLPGGRPPRAGELVPNKALARTYRRVLEEAEQRSTGRDGQIEAARSIFYEGFVAEAIDRFCRGEPVLDISGGGHRGLLGGEDLARWRAGVEEPVTAGYRGLTVCKPGPWTQGPVLLQQLRLLEHFELDGWDPVSAELIHTTTECAKLAFADREAYYGDPTFVDVPLEDLLSPGYARARAALVTVTASRELRPGSPGG
ncbi:gamma-glutamyltransferase family protein, partial [Acidimicrobiaceae bacterium USS-CC1]|nr:gamma-glutamyltransferase family protein [Acidiferrimicrobium australe]